MNGLLNLRRKHQIKKYDSVWNGCEDWKRLRQVIVTADDLSKMAEADSSSSESK